MDRHPEDLPRTHRLLHRSTGGSGHITELTHERIEGDFRVIHRLHMRHVTPGGRSHTLTIPAHLCRALIAACEDVLAAWEDE